MKKLTLLTVAVAAVISTGASAREVDSEGQRIMQRWTETGNGIANHQSQIAPADQAAPHKHKMGAHKGTHKPTAEQKAKHAEHKAKWEKMTPEQKAAKKAEHKAKWDKMTPEQKAEWKKTHPHAPGHAAITKAQRAETAPNAPVTEMQRKGNEE